MSKETTEKTVKQKPYKCINCPKRYASKAGLLKHTCKEGEASTTSFGCNRCKKVYKRKKTLENHTCVATNAEKFPYECKLCERRFARENSFIDHKCKQRLRMEELKLPSGRVAFMAYQQFYRAIGRGNSEKTPLEFVNSTYYNGFMKFGKFIQDNRITLYQDYIHYLIKYNVKLEQWGSDKIHSIYIRGLSKKEPMESAVEKTFRTMAQWADSTGNQWTDYFKKESKLRIIHNLKMGRISPWVLYNSTTGEEFIQRLDRAEMDEIYDYIDPKFWGVKLQRHQDLADAARSTLSSVGL